MLFVKTEVASGPFQGKRGPLHNFVVSPDNENALAFFFEHMEALGISKDYLQQSGILPSQLAPYLTNRTFHAKIKHEDYQGNTNMKIQTIMSGVTTTTQGTNANAAVADGLSVFRPQAPAPAPGPAPVAPPAPAPAPAAAPVAAPPLPAPAQAPVPPPGSPPPPPATPF